MRRSNRRARSGYDDEPSFDAGEVEQWSDHADLRRDIEREARGAGWARAKYVLRELIEREVGPIREIGHVKKIGDGLSREIFAAEVELADGGCDAYVVALPRRDADAALDERTNRELRLLAALRDHRFPFRVPEMVGAFPDGERSALVRRFAPGIVLDLRAGRQPSVKPWQIVGELAAAIHAVPGARLADVIPGTATRTDHAREAIAIFDGLEPPEMRDATAWALAHVAPDEPSSLLHGDLLGQNILLAVDGPPHVIDWEYARRGDPAYELAIVTRGAKRPFQLDRGLEHLLQAYRAAGGREVTANQVHVYELCLLAGFYRAALAGEGPHAPRHELDLIRGLLRRLG